MPGGVCRGEWREGCRESCVRRSRSGAEGTNHPEGDHPEGGEITRHDIVRVDAVLVLDDVDGRLSVIVLATANGVTAYTRTPAKPPPHADTHPLTDSLTHLDSHVGARLQQVLENLHSQLG